MATLTRFLALVGIALGGAPFVGCATSHEMEHRSPAITMNHGGRPDAAPAVGSVRQVVTAPYADGTNCDTTRHNPKRWQRSTLAEVTEQTTRRVNPASAAAELGIEVLGARLTAAGYLIDVRYRVCDPEKAQGWLDRHAKAYLIDEKTGARFHVPSSPKIGPLRQTARAPIAGRTYFMMFANPARFVEAGATVTVVVGDYRLEELIVQ